MSTTNINEKRLTLPRLKSPLVIGIIVVLTLVLTGIAISTGIDISEGIADQQTQNAIHNKPLTNVTSVEITGDQFAPANLQVKVGTTITWTNKDSVAHSVTFKNGMKDSGLFTQGKSYSYTFTKAGTFAYYCIVHPHMVAQVVVTN